MKLLVGYASAHGSTAEIAQFMARLLRAFDVEVTVADLNSVQDVGGYDAFIVGSAIHAGMWLQSVSLFFERFADVLKAKPVFLFITCIRVMEADGLEHALEYYVHQPTLEKVGIDTVGVFAGRLAIGAIDWNERWVLASNYDGSEASKLVNHDYRDWQAIAAWTLQVTQQLQAKPEFS
jgi:menaquinone-dependent protoporphyrinogen oxidase